MLPIPPQLWGDGNSLDQWKKLMGNSGQGSLLVLTHSAEPLSPGQPLYVPTKTRVSDLWSSSMGHAKAGHGRLTPTWV